MAFPIIELVDTNATKQSLRRKLEYFSISLIIINLINYDHFIIPNNPESISLVIFKYFVDHGHLLTTFLLTLVVGFFILTYTYELNKNETLKKIDKMSQSLNSIAAPTPPPNNLSAESVRGAALAALQQLKALTKETEKELVDGLEALVRGSQNPTLVKEFIENSLLTEKEGRFLIEDKNSLLGYYISLVRQNNAQQNKLSKITLTLHKLRTWSPLFMGTVAIALSAWKILTLLTNIL